MGKNVIIVHGAGGYGHIKAKNGEYPKLHLEIIDDQYKAIEEIRKIWKCLTN